jgi:hypothetical protein
MRSERGDNNATEDASARPFELMTEARTTLVTWLLSDPVSYMGHLSTRRYARLVDEWVGVVA